MSSRSKNDNRLSTLPEDVLSHIIPFIKPTKYAVRTSILSKRWRDAWTLVTNLDFGDSYYPGYGLSTKDFATIVDRVFECCKTPQLNLFRLCFVNSKLEKSNVLKWINKAVRLNVCELDIQVWPSELPPSLFTCKTLTKLRLDTAGGLSISNVPYHVMLRGLKTLDLCVSDKASVILLRFIHGCPVLESLSLKMMSPDSERDFKFNVPTLKRLELYTGHHAFKFVLNVPNLQYLFVGGDICPHLVMQDLPAFLVEATLSFDSIMNFHMNSELLNGLSAVKSLSWSFPYDKNFSLSHLPVFNNLKNLELNRLLKYRWLSVIQILESSPELEHFSFEEPQDSSWFEPQSVPTHIILKLKTMKITECKGRKCDIQFLEFMLGNAQVLKTLTVIWGSLCVKKEKEMCTRLLNFPRASRFCEIHFVGNDLFL